MAGDQIYLPVIGVDNLHYGKVLTDTSTGITGDTPKAIPGLTEAGFNRNGQLSTFFADGVAFCTASASGEIDGAIACADVPSGLSKELYGDTYNATTGELLLGDIKSPDIFLQYRIEKANGAWRYVTIYKCKCAPVEQKVSTKGGKIDFKTNGFSFKAANTLFNNNFCRILDDDDPNLPVAVTPKVIADNWFSNINWAIAAV